MIVKIHEDQNQIDTTRIYRRELRTGAGNLSERTYGAKKLMESILLNFRCHNSVGGGGGNVGNICQPYLLAHVVRQECLTYCLHLRGNGEFWHLFVPAST